MTRPAAVGAWVAAGLAVALGSADPVPQAVVLAGAWWLLARRREPDRGLRPLAFGLVALAAITVLVNGLLAHVGATVVVVVPSWVPLVGGQLTTEGFIEGGAIALALVAAVSVTAVLSLVLEPADLVDALPRPLHRTGAALGAALNLVPATVASFVAVRDAQRLRGWRPKGPRAMVDLAVPVLLGAIERSTELAESMEARAFGSGPRTSAAERERSGRAVVVVALAAASVVVLVVARLTGGPAWYPYPTPSVPAVTAVLLAPALLVAAAALLVPAGTA
ncbi:MAG: energy-coupling factor transporter transmembrane protein EcfT [Acidobacteriota bacterium]|nr:energy-coupling factor transporter transmembrane protein EcfT [Acidobacteriota bacterium]